MTDPVQSITGTTTQVQGTSTPSGGGAGTATPTSGQVQAFRDLSRTLTPEDLANTGVQKLVLAHLDRAVAECERLTAFEARFHDVDKQLAVALVGHRTSAAVEVAFGVGVGLGGVLIGLVPAIPEGHSSLRFSLGLVGFLLVMGGVAVRIVKR